MACLPFLPVDTTLTAVTLRSDFLYSLSKLSCRLRSEGRVGRSLTNIALKVFSWSSTGREGNEEPIGSLRGLSEEPCGLRPEVDPPEPTWGEGALDPPEPRSLWCPWSRSVARILELRDLWPDEEEDVVLELRAGRLSEELG